MGAHDYYALTPSNTDACIRKGWHSKRTVPASLADAKAGQAGSQATGTTLHPSSTKTLRKQPASGTSIVSNTNSRPCTLTHARVQAASARRPPRSAVPLSLRRSLWPHSARAAAAGRQQRQRRREDRGHRARRVPGGRLLRRPCATQQPRLLPRPPARRAPAGLQATGGLDKEARCSLCRGPQTSPCRRARDPPTRL